MPTGENSLLVLLPGSQDPEDRPSIAQALDAVRLFAVGRVFRIEALMPMASWLGIVVELTDSMSFRPSDELAFSADNVDPELLPSVVAPSYV